MMFTQNAPPRYLRTEEAGRFLGVSGRTLEKHRSHGTGPAYRKIGGRVIYSIADLQAWADRGLRFSTSEPDSGAPADPRRRQDGLTDYLSVRRRDVSRTCA